MIIIIGGGIVGLVLATALGQANFEVTVVENKLPLLHWDTNQWDARVSAINAASYQILKNLKIWPQIPANSYTPLRGLEVWDHQGGGIIHFDSADIGAPQLGFIIENRALIKILWENLASLPTVKLISPAEPLSIIHHPNYLQLQLKDQSLITGDLIVGADGSHSWVREEMSINIRERSYEQQAIIAVVHSVRPHQNIGWQSFLPSGPLGVLPLADSQTTAIVWSNDSVEAERLMALNVIDFNQQLTQALSNKLGAMTCLTPPKMIPLMMRHACDYVQQHFALVGDAAHTIHPLAGQGINLGFLDAAVLTQVLIEARQKKQNLGALRVLRRYQRWRKGDNELMLAAMRGFKELFSQQSSWLVNLRSSGLNLTDRMGWLKNLMMNYATGRQHDLPDLAVKAIDDN